MSRKIVITIGTLLGFALLAFSGSVVSYKNKKIATLRECDALRSRVNLKVNLNEEKQRLESTGLDIDLYPKNRGNSGTLWVSSSRLDHDQVGCRLEFTSDTLTSVHQH